LSGELADKLSGRYIEMRMHSLRYLEFLKFHSLENDNDGKIVVSMDEPSGGNIEDIEHIHLRVFLSTKY